MAAALRRIGLPVAIQSERDVKGDSPAYAWLTALLTIMADPFNAYESSACSANLRRVDHDLAVFSEGRKRDFASTRFYRRPEEFPRSYVRSQKFANAQKVWRYSTPSLDHRPNAIARAFAPIARDGVGDLARELDACSHKRRKRKRTE